MTPTFIPYETGTDYEIGDDTHRKLVTKLRGLPETFSWKEIDAARDEESLALLVTARGLPINTSWDEIKKIEDDDYQRKMLAQRALQAVGCELATTTTAEEALKIHALPSLIRNRQIDELETMYVNNWIKTEWGVTDLQNLLALPDPRTACIPIPKPR